ncbi:MAG TPA: hypothetical protein VHA80_05485 [Solirubrobacterales bacterium]|nr:hypothetical protein [Solirubrobacterales bacterium]
MAIALRPIGEAVRFFLTRHWERTAVGPYMVTTAEVRPGAYETTVTWGEDGPEVDAFGGGLAFDPGRARAEHEAICERVEASVGGTRLPMTRPPAA